MWANFIQFGFLAWQGAFMNGQKISVGEEADIGDAVIAAGSPLFLLLFVVVVFILLLPFLLLFFLLLLLPHPLPLSPPPCHPFLSRCYFCIKAKSSGGGEISVGEEADIGDAVIAAGSR